MILAVLEARCGVGFAGLDVYLNVAGGLRITEPAADLAVAAALMSARQDAALPSEAVIFGEVSLSGALRPIAQGGRAAARGGEARLHGGLRAGGDAGAGGRRRWRYDPLRIWRGS
jgi:DNA repair protein RadA/Sms